MSAAPERDVVAPPEVEGTPRLVRDLRIVAVASAVVWLAVVVLWSDGPFALTFDDAYYYFEIAERLADGQGSTFDGIADTNGYHPLWMAISVVPFALGLEDMAAVRALLAVQVLLWGWALWVLAGLVGRAVRGWPRLATTGRDGAARACERSLVAVFALVALNPFVVRIGVSGLESILVVIVGAVLLDRATTGPGTVVDGRDPRWVATTAALLVVALLSRTDSVLLLATLGVAGLAEVRRRDLGTRGLLVLAGLLGPATAVLAAYGAWNVAAFGGLQVSGTIKRAPLEAGTVVPFAIAVALASWLIVRSGARHERLEAGAVPRFARASTFTARTSWYGAFGALVIAYYVLLQTQQWLWYYAPTLVWLLALVVVACADLFERGVVEARPETPPSRALLPLRLIVLLPLALLLVIRVPSFLDPELRSIQVANRDAGRWISDNLPPDAVLASWDAGVLGYFTDRPVVNLDGVVNGYEWYDANQEGPEAAAEYLDDAGVTHIVNHGPIVDGEDPDIRPYVEQLWGPAVAADAVVVADFPFVFSGTTVGSGGRSAGTRDMAVWVYELPPPDER